MIEFVVLLVALFLWTPAFESGEGPNTCYVVDHAMRQVHGPCTPEMTRGRTR